MKPVQTLRKAFDRISASGAEAARPKVRRAPACEMLEGRQLLNAAWTPPQGLAGWDGAAAKGIDAAAHVHTFDAKDAKGLHRASHTFTDPTLQAKIAADEAAIVKDGGPSLPANSQGIGLPGMF